MEHEIKDLMQHKNKIIEIKKISASDSTDTIQHIKSLEENKQKYTVLQNEMNDMSINLSKLEK